MSLFWCIATSDTQSILKHWMVSPWFVSALWDGKMFQHKKVRSPSYAQKFSTAKLFWKLEKFPHENCWHCETKAFDGKTENNDTSPPSPYFLSILFSTPRNIWNTERTPLRCFSIRWDKKFRQNRDTLPPLCNKTFDTDFFQIQKGSLKKFFGTVR